MNKRIKRFLFKYCPILDLIRAKRLVNRVVNSVLFSFSEVKLAENNPDIITELLEKKKSELPTEFKKIENIITLLLDKIDFSNDEMIKTDMLFSYFAYGYTPNEYVCYGFKDKTLEQRRKFVSDRESVKYAYGLNRCSGVELFKDKSETYALFKNYYKRDLITIENKKDYDKFIYFTEKYDVFVKKNDKESCGRGVELVYRNNIYMDNFILFEKYLDEIKITGEKIILEELVHQSDIMSKFNSSSVNTIRCVTLKTKEGVVVPFCFMKVGRNGSFVDNGGAGGLLIGVDEETGILNTDAVDECGKRYERHPDTDIKFEGQKLPEWGQMISICIEMAEMIDSVKWIGWDMAHTDKGWVVIEGNHATEVIGPQATSSVGIRECLEDYLKYTKVLF